MPPGYIAANRKHVETCRTAFNGKLIGSYKQSAA